MTKCVVKNGIVERKIWVWIGAIGFAFALYSTDVPAQESSLARVPDVTVTRYTTAQSLKSLSSLQDGTWIETAGFYVPGDGGEALYSIRKPNDELQPNRADVIALKNGLVAILMESKAVNYKMFGAVGDG